MIGATASTGWAKRLRIASRLAVLLSGLALAACQTDGTGGSPMASSGNRTLAFDSIDGPPKPTFEKLVTELTSEAQAQQVPVVSRTDTSTYRVRGYLSVHSDKSKTAVSYAWEIYDADKQRVARITGEEVTKRVKGDAWAACDEEMLNRIAGKSMASLAETIGIPAPSGQARATATPAAPAAAAASPAAPAEAEPPAAAPSGPPIDGNGPPVAEIASSTTLAYAVR